MIVRRASLPGPRMSDQGFTLVELVIMIAIVGVVAVLAATGLWRSQAAANEAHAVAAMQITAQAQKAYAIACGGGAFATSYLVLRAAPPGSNAGFISPDLARDTAPLKSGYRFALAPGAGSTAGPADCHGDPTVTAFFASAEPLSILSGARSFAVAADGTVWHRSGGRAPTQPFGRPAAPVQ